MLKQSRLKTRPKPIYMCFYMKLNKRRLRETEFAVLCESSN